MNAATASSRFFAIVEWASPPKSTSDTTHSSLFMKSSRVPKATVARTTPLIAKPLAFDYPLPPRPDSRQMVDCLRRDVGAVGRDVLVEYVLLSRLGFDAVTFAE